MARYIDADALEKFIENGLNNPCKLKAFGNDAIQIMAEVHYMPTADVAPVVRCKDCVYRYSSEYCECRPEDAFCSDGERKADNG